LQQVKIRQSLRQGIALVVVVVMGMMGGDWAAALDPVPAGATPIMDPAKLREIYAGNTMIGINRFPDQPELKWSEFQCRNGQTRWAYDGRLYPGRWSAQDGHVCFAYDDIAEGTMYCFDVYDDENGGYKLVATTEPELGFVVFVSPLPGDPLKIQKLDGGSCEDATS